MLKLILIGAGQRGNIYANYCYENEKAKIVAVVEPNNERRDLYFFLCLYLYFVISNFC